MGSLAKYILSVLIFAHPDFGFAAAETASVSAPAMCPARLDLTMEEQSALFNFNARLSYLQRDYGMPGFAAKLNDLLEAEWPTRSVIEVSPVFVERVSVMVDQQYLKDAVASTIGLDDENWREFEKVMRRVTLSEGMIENKHGAFTQKTQKLVDAIQQINMNRGRHPELTNPGTLEIQKARAVALIASLSITLNRWSLINKEIANQRVQGHIRHFTMVSMGLAATTVIVGSVFVAEPLIHAAAAAGSLVMMDPVVAMALGRVIQASTLPRLMQVGAGMAMGLVGAPTTQLLADSSQAMMEARRQSQNKGTLYVCELDAQIKSWKARGMAPYLKESVIGGGIASVGGLATLWVRGAKVVHVLTGAGVATAFGKTGVDFTLNSIGAWNEYSLAKASILAGNRASAIQHLQAARLAAQKQGHYAVDSVIVGVLASAVGVNFLPAYRQGEEAIRALYAASSDTIPKALHIVIESVRPGNVSRQ